MKQLALFPEEIKVVCWTNGISSELEKIAKDASHNPLLCGETRGDTPQTRYERFQHYVKLNDFGFHVIKNGERIIGGAYIDDGWIPTEMDYVEPSIELAFVDPASLMHAGMILRKLYEKRLEVKENT